MQAWASTGRRHDIGHDGDDGVAWVIHGVLTGADLAGIAEQAAAKAGAVVRNARWEPLTRASPQGGPHLNFHGPRSRSAMAQVHQ